MHNYIIDVKRIFIIYSFLISLIITFTLQAEEFYFVDSIGHCGYAQPSQIDAQFKADVLTPSGWKRIGKSDIWLGAENCKTFIYVHGNLTDRDLVMQNGMLICQYLNQTITDKNYKFIVWFWDSSKIYFSYRRDAINSENRSRWESFYLARFLESAPQMAQIRLIGYSFGTNTVLGACQLLSGGAVNGFKAPGQSGEIQSLLIAPAIPTGAFLSGDNGWGKSLECQTHCDITFNEMDTALRWYHLVAPDGCSDAMGRYGIDGLPEGQNQKVTYYDVTLQVGATHKLDAYLGQTNLISIFAGR